LLSQLTAVGKRYQFKLAPHPATISAYSPEFKNTSSAFNGQFVLIFGNNGVLTAVKPGTKKQICIHVDSGGKRAINLNSLKNSLQFKFAPFTTTMNDIVYQGGIGTQGQTGVINPDSGGAKSSFSKGSLPTLAVFYRSHSMILSRQSFLPKPTSNQSCPLWQSNQAALNLTCLQLNGFMAETVSVFSGYFVFPALLRSNEPG